MKHTLMTSTAVLLAALGALSLSGCSASIGATAPAGDEPEFFMLRPEVEKAYGYAHAVKIGRHVTVSGAVSMDDEGNPTAVGDMNQQMLNVYADLEEVLAHYGYTFADVVVENVLTTDMATFLELSTYRNSVYPEQFPAGTWAQVEALALPEFMIEIELEAYRSN